MATNDAFRSQYNTKYQREKICFLLYFWTDQMMGQVQILGKMSMCHPCPPSEPTPSHTKKYHGILKAMNVILVFARVQCTMILSQHKYTQFNRYTFIV